MNTLKVGDKIPKFECLDDKGNTVKSENFKGNKLVVFFYPRANTPGCTAEACNLRYHYKALQFAGFELIGVSADNQKKQSNFAKKHELPFTLLADENKAVIDAFGVWGPKKFQGREYDGIHRTTFIVNKEGVVDKVISKVKTKEHAAQIISDL